MNPLVITYALNGLLMIAMPICLAIILIRRWKISWNIWWIGAATFVLSQVGHIPFNWGIGQLLNWSGMVYLAPVMQQILNASFLGLSVGLFEEGARYLVLRFWAKDARSWRTGIVFGAGHGGGEAILLGMLGLFGFIQLMILRDATPTQLAQMVGTENVALARIQLEFAWSIPWPMTLLGALERFFTIPIQICLAVLMMRAFTQKQSRWLIYAILYHALVDGVVVALQNYLTVVMLEAVVGLFAVLSLVLIFILRQPEPPQERGPVLEPVVIPLIKPVDETQDNLENTRFRD